MTRGQVAHDTVSHVPNCRTQQGKTCITAGVVPQRGVAPGVDRAAPRARNRSHGSERSTVWSRRYPSAHSTPSPVPGKRHAVAHKHDPLGRGPRRVVGLARPVDGRRLRRARPAPRRRATSQAVAFGAKDNGKRVMVVLRVARTTRSSVEGKERPGDRRHREGRAAGSPRRRRDPPTHPVAGESATSRERSRHEIPATSYEPSDLPLLGGDTPLATPTRRRSSGRRPGRHIAGSRIALPGATGTPAPDARGGGAGPPSLWTSPEAPRDYGCAGDRRRRAQATPSRRLPRGRGHGWRRTASG